MEDIENFDVVYIKLTNGEELFATSHGVHDGMLMLEEVLILETVHSEDAMKYQFMSRYAPYSRLQSMRLDLKNVIFVQEASESVKRHYAASLDYARTISDARFQEGIAEATVYLKRVMQKAAKKAEAAGPLEQFMARYESDTNTKH